MVKKSNALLDCLLWIGRSKVQIPEVISFDGNEMVWLMVHYYSQHPLNGVELFASW